MDLARRCGAPNRSAQLTQNKGNWLRRKDHELNGLARKDQPSAWERSPGIRIQRSSGDSDNAGCFGTATERRISRLGVGPH